MEKTQCNQKTIESLTKELEEFRREKETIRQQIGHISGKSSEKKDAIINIVFIIAIAVLFFMDIIRHMFKIDLPLPQIFSLELGMLLLSIKLIWMIYKQSKIEHFQFWILNSIEYRLNSVSRRVNDIAKHLKSHEKDGADREVL